MQCGGDVHGKNRLSETLLHKICGYNNHANQRAKAVQLLIRQGKCSLCFTSFCLSLRSLTSQSAQGL